MTTIDVNQINAADDLMGQIIERLAYLDDNKDRLNRYRYDTEIKGLADRVEAYGMLTGLDYPTVLTAARLQMDDLDSAREIQRGVALGLY